MTSPTAAVAQLQSLVASDDSLDSPPVMQLSLDALSGVSDPEISDALYKRLMAGFADDLFTFVTGNGAVVRGKILETFDRIENQSNRNPI